MEYTITRIKPSTYIYVCEWRKREGHRTNSKVKNE